MTTPYVALPNYRSGRGITSASSTSEASWALGSPCEGCLAAPRRPPKVWRRELGDSAEPSGSVREVIQTMAKKKATKKKGTKKKATKKKK
jgi:hypothetical protein